MSQLHVRAASTSDLDEMLALWRALEAVQGLHRIFPMVGDPEGKIRALLLDAIDHPESRVFVVDGTSGLLGMAVARIEEQGPRSMSSARIVELSRVVVVPAARGSGIGRALIEAAASFGAEHGASYLTAKLFSGNATGRGFWERMGFVPRYEERVRPIGASGAADILGSEEAD